MSENELQDTQPHPVEETQPAPVKENTQPRPTPDKFPRWTMIALIALILLIGALAGYGTGMGQRYDAEATQVAAQLQEQLELGIKKMNAGQYDLAQQYFDFIIQKDPDFPGVMEAYTELLLRKQMTPTPVPSLTPVQTPTPDLRGAEALYESIQTALLNRDWDTALQELDTLRKTAPDYKTAQVDGLYYLTLRMRGVYKIIVTEGETCRDVNLEGGIYDMTRAERFGTLDALAQGLRTYARLYLIGASYWDQDWVKAQDYFAQVMAGYPDLMDSSCMTATERWRFATIKYAEQLLAAGDTCGAEEQFNLAFTVPSAKNEPYYPTATEVAVQCDGGDGGGEPPATDTPVETPTPFVPTETPTP